MHACKYKNEIPGGVSSRSLTSSGIEMQPFVIKKAVDPGIEGLEKDLWNIISDLLNKNKKFLLFITSIKNPSSMQSYCF